MSALEVIVYSSTGCPHCENVKNALKEWGISYEEKNVSESKEAYDELRAMKIFGVPATLINGKKVLGFQEAKLKKALGMTEEAIEKATAPRVQEEKQAEDEIFKEVDQAILDDTYDFVIIGGGPAGASAAVYGSRSKLKTLVIDKAPKSGALAVTHRIANYPGVRGEVTGMELLEMMQKQGKDFGATFVRSNVLSVDFSDEIKKIMLPEGTIKAKAVFIAVGAKAAGSKIKGEEELAGRGVSYCSTCDAAFYQEREVIVVGDTEEAVHEAEQLAKFCKKVNLLLPTGQIKGEANLSALEEKENVEIFNRYRVREIRGEDNVESVVIINDKREEQVWEVDGVFLYLGGMKPGTEFLRGAVDCDEEGYVNVDEQLRTNVEGVFAGGDARRTIIKQAVISAADGAIAALGADQYVNDKKKLLPQY
ncbi:MAG TPA: FAD-dependent oxidoreductase [Bacilli bacterium]|nr:FAD-dependent oxidoreductase [Bacilli bacterium]